MKEFDIIVIGAGAGTKLVTPPSLLGKKVAVFEKESPGGTCLNRGCIPSKMLIYPSEIVRLTKESAKFPLVFKEPVLADLLKITSRITETVQKDSDSIPLAYHKNPNVEYLPYQARFESNRVVIANGERYTAPIVVIAVGTRPSIPKGIGLEGTPFWTSREALRPSFRPKKMTVVGGGYIGLELGAAYSAFGTEVELFTRHEILRQMDSEVVAELRKCPPLSLNENHELQSVQYSEGEFKIQWKGIKKETACDSLLVATGIIPNTDDLGCENTKIRVDDRGYIQVDEYLETDEPGIFAFGDCIGNYFFRHSANFEGEFLFENLFKKNHKDKIQYPPMPSAVFTMPQIASVGLREEDIKVPYWKGVNRYSSSAMGMARMSEVGFVKILASKDTQEILGVHIIGEEASNLIQLFVLGMTHKLKLDEYLKMIFIHPALPEVSRNALRKIREIRDKNE